MAIAMQKKTKAEAALQIFSSTVGHNWLINEVAEFWKKTIGALGWVEAVVYLRKHNFRYKVVIFVCPEVFDRTFLLFMNSHFSTSQKAFWIVLSKLTAKFPG